MTLKDDGIPQYLLIANLKSDCGQTDTFYEWAVAELIKQGYIKRASEGKLALTAAGFQKGAEIRAAELRHESVYTQPNNREI